MTTRITVAVEGKVLSGKLSAALTGLDAVALQVEPETHAWEKLKTAPADLCIVTPAGVGHPLEERLAELRCGEDSPQVILLVPRPDPLDFPRLCAAGCDAVLGQDSGVESIRQTVVELRERRDHKDLPEGSFGKIQDARLSDFVSLNHRMRNFMHTVGQVVNREIPLLILGETGVGKEHLARAIYAAGPRSEGQFVAVNCGALPESLLESELFGHEKGAFTGASHRRRGMFEMAERGVVFLDEIGEMPLTLQTRLLRVLQNHTVRRVGGEQSIPVDMRVMAASNKDLEKEAAQGRFRSDLLYRLNVMPLEIPSLRERPEDIRRLVHGYLRGFRHHSRYLQDGIAQEALDSLCRYDWPGNTRQLINVVQRATVVAEGCQVTLRDLPEFLRDLPPEPRPAEAEPPLEEAADHLSEMPWKRARQEAMALFEKAYLVRLLKKTGGVVGETARLAGMNPRSLYEKMKRHGLDKEDFR